MPKVARVIYNRLAQDMPLQMDSTVLYAIGQDGGPVTAQDLQIQSPYNTYLNKGLTPTPICMPSHDRADGRGATRRRVPGSTSCWCRRTASWPSPTRSPSSWPTSSWRSPVASPEPGGEPCEPGTADDGGGPGRCGPDGHVVGVIGSPVAHSLSPLLHNAAFAALGLGRAGARSPSRSPPGQAGRALEDMRRADVTGLSVTMPHKADVAALWSTSAATWHAGSARSTASINREGALYGTNTDGEGFVASLARGAGFDPAGRRCLVIGAGGAARAVVLALAEAGAAEVAVVNRTPERAFEAAALAGVRRSSR